MADGASRLAVAAHPAAVGALVALVVNDHVLKAWSGGIEGGLGVVARTATGKASDIAGVLLLAVWLGALGGRRRLAVAAVGVGFTALKLSPLVAELAIPVLGGRTRTDPWDLIALVALVPADRILRPGDAARPLDLRPAWASLRTTLGLAVVVASVPAMTATSPCDEEPPVGLSTIAILDDGTLVTADDTDGADVDDTDPDIHWASVDDGRTWAATASAPGVLADSRTVRGADQVCTDEGCFRRAEGGVIERETDRGWERSFSYSRQHRARMDADQSACGPDLAPRIVALVATDDGTVVATAGRYGVVRRAPGGIWEHVGVGEWREPSTLPAAWPRHLRHAPYIAAIAYGLLFWLTLRRVPFRSVLRPLSAFFAVLGTILAGGLGLLVYAGSQGGGSARDDGLGVGVLTGIVFVLAVLPLVPLLLGFGGKRIEPGAGPEGSPPPMASGPEPPRSGPPARYPGDPGPPPPGPSGWI